MIFSALLIQVLNVLMDAPNFLTFIYYLSVFLLIPKRVMKDFPVVFLTNVYKCTITLIEFQLEKDNPGKHQQKDSYDKMSDFSVHKNHLESL